MTPIAADGSWDEGANWSTDNSYLIHPFSEYDNAEEFFSNFPPMSIPFMGDFSIQVVDDEAEDGTANVCFKGAMSLLFINLTLALTTTLTFLI